MTIREAPEINGRCVCIVDREATVLAAVISSYLFKTASYVPLFLFPTVTTFRAEESEQMTEGYFAELMGGQTSVLIGNAIARLGNCDYVILAGLNGYQKSFLNLPPEIKTIEIAEVLDVYRELSFLGLPTNGELRCRAADVLTGLDVAQKQGKRLVIDEGASIVPAARSGHDGLIVIESVDEAAAVVAVNYANSVGASVYIVAALGKYEDREIREWIQEWREKGNPGKRKHINDVVLQRINPSLLAGFGYATFFTEGIPYTLVIENIIPCSYVHLSLRPDLFVFNSIYSFDGGENFHSAVVFSPVFFQDEETQWLCGVFENSSYHLRPLIGKEATVSNFDFYAQYFPYDILHICSHGGEVEGYEMSASFRDRDGQSHLVEFDEVVGYTPIPNDPSRVRLHRKIFPRRVDGIPWMSSELKSQNIPSHVYNDMWKCMVDADGRRTPKGIVAMSCSIACADSIHQGALYCLASHSAPIIFNNSCWSWSEVAAFFLSCGARGYIGTLWDIGNDAAVVAAKEFYASVFDGTVLTSIHAATKSIDATGSKDIYIYWGLHFSRLRLGQAEKNKTAMVRNELVASVHRWLRHIESTKSTESRGNAIRILESILEELRTNFGSDGVRKLQIEVMKKLSELTKGDVKRDRAGHESRSTRSSAEGYVQDIEIRERNSRFSPKRLKNIHPPH